MQGTLTQDFEFPLLNVSLFSVHLKVWTLDIKWTEEKNSGRHMNRWGWILGKRSDLDASKGQHPALILPSRWKCPQAVPMHKTFYFNLIHFTLITCKIYTRINWEIYTTQDVIGLQLRKQMELDWAYSAWEDQDYDWCFFSLTRVFSLTVYLVSNHLGLTDWAHFILPCFLNGKPCLNHTFNIPFPNWFF